MTRQADWFSLLLVTGVMVTGFASAHGFGSESFMALLHVLFGEAILICLPFTRLSHAILIPFTRAYMGFRIHRRPSYLRLVILEAHDGY